MKTEFASGLTMLCAIFLLSGCGGTKSAESAEEKKSLLSRVTTPISEAAKTVAGVVSKPFDGNKNDKEKSPTVASQPRSEARQRTDLAARTCSDNYETVRPGLRRRDAWAEPREEYRANASETAAPARKAQPRPVEVSTSARSGDADTVSALEQEYKRIAEREEIESSRLKEYRDKKRELEEIIREYENRYSMTQERKKKIEILMSALENDPETLDRAVRRELDETAASRQPEDDLRACAAPGADGWKPSRGARPSSAASSFQPEIESDYNRRSAAVGRSARESGLTPPPEETEMSRAAEDQPLMSSAIATTVLAAEGSGADAVAILGAGTLQGVCKGMLFAAAGGVSPRPVLVVTEVYPTYARAQIHPQYANAGIRIREQVVQIPELPGKQ